LVLNIAQKENVSFDELKKINGTGLQGRVTKKDILSYLENRGTKQITATPSPSFIYSEFNRIKSPCRAKI